MAPPAFRYVNRRFVPLRWDFFERYDLLCTREDCPVMVMIQISTEHEGSHADPGPLGINKEDVATLDYSVDELLKEPAKFLQGIFEVYEYWRKLGKRRVWTPDRRWWNKP